MVALAAPVATTRSAKNQTLPSQVSVRAGHYLTDRYYNLGTLLGICGSRDLEVDDDTYEDPQNPANKQASNRLRRQVQPVTNLQAKNRPKRPKRVRPAHDPHKTRALKLRLAKRLKNNHPCPVKNGYGKHEPQGQNKRATHS